MSNELIATYREDSDNEELIAALRVEGLTPCEGVSGCLAVVPLQITSIGEWTAVCDACAEAESCC